jgi:hypothetical protein
MGVGGLAQRSLREAKSFGDLQARTASPALSTSSFPVGLSQNAGRYQQAAREQQAREAQAQMAAREQAVREQVQRDEYNLRNGADALGISRNISASDDAYLSNGFGNLNLGSVSGYDAQPRGTSRLAGQNRSSNLNLNGGESNGVAPIGSHRLTNQSSLQNLNGINGLSSLSLGSYQDVSEPRNQSVGASVERQPRGPGAEWGAGFGRPSQRGGGGHANRGSGDLDLSELDRERQQMGGDDGIPVGRSDGQHGRGRYL